MSEFTLDQLVATLRECAGEDESVDLTADILDTTFEDLGYDSLALLNTVTRIERDRGIGLPEDEAVGEGATPRQLLRLVNERIQQPA
jgi:act minimal PKS acyl carrier protein